MKKDQNLLQNGKDILEGSSNFVVGLKSILEGIKGGCALLSSNAKDDWDDEDSSIILVESHY